MTDTLRAAPTALRIASSSSRALSPVAQASLDRLALRLTGPDQKHDMADDGFRRRRPVPGWNAGTTPLSNPRPPAVPASLQLTLAEYYAAAATIGLLAAQDVEPDPEWAAKWSLDFGARMAREAQRRRRKSSPPKESTP